MTPHAKQDQPDGLLLPGLDGTNPLGFLAAMGVFHIMSQSDQGGSARMFWTAKDSWYPVVYADSLTGHDGIVDMILAYNDSLKSSGTSPQRQRLDFASLTNDDILSIEPDVFTDAVDRAFDFAERDRPRALRRETLDFIASYGAPCCIKDNGKIEPSAFSFANGQGGKKLLAGFRAIRNILSRDHVIRTIASKWDYADTTTEKGVCVFRWDPNDRRLYAHMGTAPANTKTGTMLAANYLAFLGLSMFPSVPGKDGLLTTGFFRSNRDNTWSWPIWRDSAGPDTVRSLLALAELGRTPVDTDSLKQMGIQEVFRSHKTIDDKGNVYFCPSVPA